MPDAPASAPAAAPAAATTPSVPVVAGKAAEASKPGAPTAAAPVAEAEPKFKVKVNGEEKEVALSDLQKHYGTFEASQSAMRKAAEQTKLAEEALSHVKQGTVDALRAAGLTTEQIRQLSVEVLAEEYQALQEEDRKKGLSAEQRELEEARAKLKKADDDKVERDKTERAANVSQQKQRISAAVIDTLEQFPEAVRRNEMLAGQVFNAWAYVIEHPEEAQKLGIELTPDGIKAALVKRLRPLVRELMIHDKDEELDEYLAPTVKGRLFKTQKAAAEAAAHPSLTSQPQTRNSHTAAPNGAPKGSAHRLLRQLSKPYGT